MIWLLLFFSAYGETVIELTTKQWSVETETTDCTTCGLRKIDCSGHSSECISLQSGRISSRNGFSYGTFVFEFEVLQTPSVEKIEVGTRRNLGDCTVHKIHSKKKCGGSVSKVKAGQTSCSDRAKASGANFFAFQSKDKCEIPTGNPYDQCAKSPTSKNAKKYDVFEIRCPPPTAAPSYTSPSLSPTATSPSGTPSTSPSEKDTTNSPTIDDSVSFTDPPILQNERISIVMEFQGVTNENKDDICNSVAKSLDGICSYASLDGPSGLRRQLQSQSLYMDIFVKSATNAHLQLDSSNFVSNLKGMPAGVTFVDSIQAPTMEPPIAISTTAEEDLCSTKPCANGGSCRVSGSDFICECSSAYTGKRCETNKNYSVKSMSYKSVKCTTSPSANTFPQVLQSQPSSGYCNVQNADLQNFSSNRDICERKGAFRNICSRFTWEIHSSSDMKINYRAIRKQIDFDNTAIYLDGALIAEGARSLMSNFDIVLENEGDHTIEVFGFESCCAGNNKGGYHGWAQSIVDDSPSKERMLEYSQKEAVFRPFMMQMTTSNEGEFFEESFRSSTPSYCIMLTNIAKGADAESNRIGMCVSSTDLENLKVTMTIRKGEDYFRDVVELQVSYIDHMPRYQIDWHPDMIVWRYGNQVLREIHGDSFPIPSGKLKMQAFVSPQETLHKSQDELALHSVRYERFEFVHSLKLGHDSKHSYYWLIFDLCVILIIFLFVIYSLWRLKKSKVPSGYMSLSQGNLDQSLLVI